MRVLYSVLLYLLTPLILLRLLWRSRELPAYRQRIGERFGFVAAPLQPIAVWVHAVSVGEALAALPLIHALVARHGVGRVWVTTTTPTGSERVRALLGDEVLHSYAPYDLPHVVARFLGRVRPERIVVMETELWPNLLRAAARRRVPLTIANARLSPRSLRGYSRVAGLARRTLADCAAIAAQSEADAARFRMLGAPAARVSVMGNIKFDQTVPEAQIDAGRALRARIGSRPVWIAASTHEGEEERLLDTQRQLLAARPETLLILVPRHPQRFDEVGRLIERKALAMQRRSRLGELKQATPLDAETQVLLGDSMGEMFAYFAAADLAFVGGSLVAVGGHNVLEPAALGLPVLFGPHMHNFVAARDLLLDARAALQVDAGALAGTVAALLADAPRRAALGDAGRAVVAANRGALQRLLQLLQTP